MRDSLIYISYFPELGGDRTAIYNEQNVAALEQSALMNFSVHGTYWDRNCQLYREKRPALEAIYKRLYKNQPFIITIYNISVISPCRDDQLILLKPFKKLNKIKFIECQTFEGESEVLHDLGLNYIQPELDY